MLEKSSPLPLRSYQSRRGRIHIGIYPSAGQRDLIHLAAALSGRSITGFAVEAAVEWAKLRLRERGVPLPESLKAEEAGAGNASTDENM